MLNVSISAKTEAALRMKAAAAGVDVAVYAGRYLELMLEGKHPITDASGEHSEDSAEHGMSEDAIASFIEDEIHQMRAERRGQKK